MGETEAVRDAFVQLWGRMGPFWGVSPAAARVYGFLLSRADGATAEEIVDGLSMSRGAVSMAARELRDWGLSTASKEPGERGVLHRAESDLEKSIRNIVLVRKRREWDPILEHLREWIPRLRADRSRDAALFRERLEAIEGLVGLADSLAENFLKGGVVGNLGLKMMVAAAKRKQGRKT
jgi:DNA-binding transcriptional regulator GbsR (MarR family)